MDALESNESSLNTCAGRFIEPTDAFMESEEFVGEDFPDFRQLWKTVSKQQWRKMPTNLLHIVMVIMTLYSRKRMMGLIDAFTH